MAAAFPPETSPTTSTMRGHELDQQTADPIEIVWSVGEVGNPAAIYYRLEKVFPNVSATETKVVSFHTTCPVTTSTKFRKKQVPFYLTVTAKYKGSGETGYAFSSDEINWYGGNITPTQNQKEQAQDQDTITPLKTILTNLTDSLNQLKKIKGITQAVKPYVLGHKEINIRNKFAFATKFGVSNFSQLMSLKDKTEVVVVGEINNVTKDLRQCLHYSKTPIHLVVDFDDFFQTYQCIFSVAPSRSAFDIHEDIGDFVRIILNTNLHSFSWISVVKTMDEIKQGLKELLPQFHTDSFEKFGYVVRKSGEEGNFSVLLENFCHEQRSDMKSVSFVTGDYTNLFNLFEVKQIRRCDKICAYFSVYELKKVHYKVRGETQKMVREKHIDRRDETAYKEIQMSTIHEVINCIQKEMQNNPKLKAKAIIAKKTVEDCMKKDAKKASKSKPTVRQLQKCDFCEHLKIEKDLSAYISELSMPYNCK